VRPLYCVLAVIEGAVVLSTIPAAAQPSNPPTVAAPSRPQTASPPVSSLPIVWAILDHERELGLSASQVDGLKRLGLDVLREMIRRQADLMVAQVDLWALMDRDPDETTDVAGVEAKIRQVAEIKADVQIALVRAGEAAKSQLTPEQRSMLTALLTGAASGQGDPPGASENVGEARGPGAASSGGAGSPPSAGRPSGSRPSGAPPSGGRPSGAPPSGGRPPGGPPSGSHPPGGHPPTSAPPHGHHGGGYVWVEPFWWGAPYPYWYYPYYPYPYYPYGPPPAVVEPPQYIQQEPSPYWYYCPSAGAYYPNVSTCPEPWVLVAPRG